MKDDILEELDWPDDDCFGPDDDFPEDERLLLSDLVNFYAQCPIAEPTAQDQTSARRVQTLDLLGRPPTYNLQVFRLPTHDDRFAYVVTEGQPLMPQDLLDKYGPGTYRLRAMSTGPWQGEEDRLHDEIFVEVREGNEDGSVRIYRRWPPA